MASTVSTASMVERGLTTAEVAAAMGCHVATVRRHIKDGKIAAARWGSEYRIKQSELERIQREGTITREATNA